MNPFKKLSFVKKENVTDDIYTFHFSRPTRMHHQAGQHGVFMLPGLYRPHPFTLSSSPDEQYVSISTHVRTGSRFKERLMAMQPGDAIWMLGPVMNFTFDPLATKYVFLAQGIGITPFRSMLVYAKSTEIDIQSTLIHVDRNAHPFRPLTSTITTVAQYPSTHIAFRDLVKQLDTEQLFYLSGSPKFIKSTKEVLVEMGVSKKNVRGDSFFGY